MFRRIARPLLAATFIYAGVDALRDPTERATKATGLVNAAAERFGTPADPATAVRLNGGVMVAGGLGLATGVAPRTSALALAAALVPTTIATHPFWESPKEERSGQLLQFLKNVGLFAGLLLMVDTPYAAQRAGRKAVRAHKAEQEASGREKASHKAEKQARKQTKVAAAVEAKAEKAQAKAAKAEARLDRKRDKD